MSVILREESPDPWYTRFWTHATDQALLEELVAPSIARFAEAGFKTALVLEKEAETYLIHCLAVHVEKDQTQTPKAVSQQAAPLIQDHVQAQAFQASSIAPTQVSFFDRQ